MTDHLSNGFVCVPVGTGTAVLTFGTEGEEMVIDLKAPGYPRASVRMSIALGTELRDRYLETLANAQIAAGVRARAERDDERERLTAALREVIVPLADKL